MYKPRIKSASGAKVEKVMTAQNDKKLKISIYTQGDGKEEGRQKTNQENKISHPKMK